MKRTYKSGSEKRHAAKASKAATEKLPKVTNFFSPSASADIQVTDADADSDTDPSTSEEQTGVNRDELTEHQQARAGPDGQSPDPVPEFTPLSDDPADWPDDISDKQKCDIIRRGPIQVNIEFPVNSATPPRRFKSGYYKRVMVNGEKVHRSWLVYSVKQDSIFCFCCVLFSTADIPLRRGTSTWEGLSKKLQVHEKGNSHQSCLHSWVELKQRIKSGSCIDQKEMDLLFQEREFWKSVIARLIDIAMFLSERNLAFRGSVDTLGSKENGNFLGILELLARYDPVSKELCHRVTTSKSNTVNYLSHHTQNELIQLISAEIEAKNVSQLKSAKYFAVVLDCTPDISHEEQMSIVFRVVKCHPGKGIEITENFYGYLNVGDTTGQGLFDALVAKLTALTIDLKDCRGQAYDNGANMKGRIKGVQARVLEVNKKALFIPCAAHSLNLVVVDAAKSSHYASTFFGVINRLYTIFSSSPQRWEIIKSTLPITVKMPSDTRWESRVNAVKPIRYHFKEVVSCLDQLEQLALGKGDGATAGEARSLSDNIAIWPFVISVVVWYDILVQVNMASKLFQCVNVTFDSVQTELKACQSFLEEYRESGFRRACATASEIANDLQLEQTFPEPRSRGRKRLFDYECQDEGTHFTAEQRFANDFFNVLVDQAMSSLTDRFSQLSAASEVFGFLQNSENLIRSHQQLDLHADCQRFADKTGDIDPLDMEHEVVRFIHVIKTQQRDKPLTTAVEFLQYIYETELHETYPNLAIALRVLLTVPLTVATAERSFSKLKLIKSFNRSTMLDSRLSNLAMISIENNTARSLNVTDLVNNFASRKERRRPL